MEALTAADRAAIAAHGLTEAEVARQLALLRDPPAPQRLARAATVGDGVVTLAESEHAGLLALADEAARAGRLTKFVPASGAASRMFAFLLAERTGESGEERFFEKAFTSSHSPATSMTSTASRRRPRASWRFTGIRTGRAPLSKNISTRPRAPCATRRGSAASISPCPPSTGRRSRTRSPR